jgi:tRNA (cmo5U34)-methyltransferase
MAPEEWKTSEHVLRYLDRADGFPHRGEGEGVLLEHVPVDARRVLDLGTGNGRLLALLPPDRPQMRGVGLDFSEVMLRSARARFAADERVELLEPGGLFANFEHVASTSERLHLAFFAAIDEPITDADPSDRLLDVHSRLEWLREIGFEDVDCYWKWLEMALLIDVKPGAR